MSVFYDTVARFYDAETADKTDDLMLYSQLVQDYGEPVLDVGCGTGRVLLHLAQNGCQVHGVDDSQQMLDRLETRLEVFPHLRETLTYTKADILTWETDQVFRLSLLTYNAMMHFHTQDRQIQLLRQLHHLTASDGLLVIDLPNAGEIFGTPDSDSLIFDRTFLDPETGHMIMLQSLSYLNRTEQLMSVRWVYDEITADGTLKRMVVPHMLRYYFYAEMQLLLQLTGFDILTVYGDTDESPYEEGCERMLIYAQPQND